MKNVNFTFEYPLLRGLYYIWKKSSAEISTVYKMFTKKWVKGVDKRGGKW